MKVVPRPQDNGFEAHQFTVESREFVVRWTDGIFHNDPDPRNWALLLHVGNGVANEAHLGDWIVRHAAGHFEILSCDQFDRRYERLDRAGNPPDKPANPPRAKPASAFADCGCSVVARVRCPAHAG